MTEILRHQGASPDDVKSGKVLRFTADPRSGAAEAGPEAIRGVLTVRMGPRDTLHDLLDRANALFSLKAALTLSPGTLVAGRPF